MDIRPTQLSNTSSYTQRTTVATEHHARAITPDRISDFRSEFELKITGFNAFSKKAQDTEFSVPSLPVGHPYSNQVLDVVKHVAQENYDIKIINYSDSVNIECTPREEKKDVHPPLAFRINANKLEEIIVNSNRAGQHHTIEDCYTVDFRGNSNRALESPVHYGTHAILHYGDTRRAPSPLRNEVLLDRTDNASPELSFSLNNVNSLLPSYGPELTAFWDDDPNLKQEESHQYAVQDIKLDIEFSAEKINDAINNALPLISNDTQSDPVPTGSPTLTSAPRTRNLSPSTRYLLPSTRSLSPSANSEASTSSHVSTPGSGDHHSPYTTPLASRIFEISQTLKNSNNKKVEMDQGITFELVDAKDNLQKSMWADIKFALGGGAIIKFKRCIPFRPEETLMSHQEKWKGIERRMAETSEKLADLKTEGGRARYEKAQALYMKNVANLEKAVPTMQKKFDDLKGELGSTSMPESFEDLPEKIRNNPELHVETMEVELHPAVGRHDAYYTLEEKQNALADLKAKKRTMPQDTEEDRKKLETMKEKIKELKKSVGTVDTGDSAQLQHRGSYVRVGVHTSKCKTICEQTRYGRFGAFDNTALATKGSMNILSDGAKKRKDKLYTQGATALSDADKVIPMQDPDTFEKGASSIKEKNQLEVLNHLFAGLKKIDSSALTMKAKEQAQKNFFESYFSSLGDPMLSWNDIALDLESKTADIEHIIMEARIS